MDTELLNAELTDIRQGIARLANVAIDDHDPGLFLLISRLTRELGNVRAYVNGERTVPSGGAAFTAPETMDEMMKRHRDEWWRAFSVEPPRMAPDSA